MRAPRQRMSSVKSPLLVESANEDPSHHRMIEVNPSFLLFYRNAASGIPDQPDKREIRSKEVLVRQEEPAVVLHDPKWVVRFGNLGAAVPFVAGVSQEPQELSKRVLLQEKVPHVNEVDLVFDQLKVRLQAAILEVGLI